MKSRIIVEDGKKKYLCARCKSYYPAEEMARHKGMIDDVGSYCLSCKSLAGKERRLKQKAKRQDKIKLVSFPNYARFLPVNEREIRYPPCEKEVRNTLIVKYFNNKPVLFSFYP